MFAVLAHAIMPLMIGSGVRTLTTTPIIIAAAVVVMPVLLHVRLSAEHDRTIHDMPATVPVLDRNPLLERLNERNHHKKRVGRVAQRLLRAQVFPVHRELVDREPSDLFDLAPRPRLEFRLLGDARDDVESNRLVVYVDLEVLVVDELTGDVVAGLFEDFADGAFRLGLLFEDFSFGEAPRSLGPEALHEQDVLHGFVEHDGAVGGHGVLEDLPLVEDVVDLVGVLHEEGAVAEDVLGEGAYAARLELVVGGGDLRVELAHEVVALALGARVLVVRGARARGRGGGGRAG